MERHILARTMHDVGLAAWFGGSLFGAVGLNGAAASLRDPEERSAAATKGWSRWIPINVIAVGAHLFGASRLLQTEKGRVARQDGVARSSAIKTGLTAASLATTAYSGLLNRKMAAAGHVSVKGATEPGPNTPPDVAKTQQQLKAVQWLIPGLTASLVGVTAWQSEQMRPKQVLAGSLPSLPGVPSGGLPLVGLVAGGAAIFTLARRLTSGSKSRSAYDSSPAPIAYPGTTPSAVPSTGTTIGTTTTGIGTPSTPTRSLTDPDGPGMTRPVGDINLNDDATRSASEIRSSRP